MLLFFSLHPYINLKLIELSKLAVLRDKIMNLRYSISILLTSKSKHWTIDEIKSIISTLSESMLIIDQLIKPIDSPFLNLYIQMNENKYICLLYN